MKKPTIAELEAILEEKDVAIEILPNGEVYVRSEIDSLRAELELARRVADVAVAEQITGHAWERVRRIFPLDHDAKAELGWANEVARVALDAAVREYRASVEAAAFMAQPGVRRGLEGVGEMEED